MGSNQVTQDTSALFIGKMQQCYEASMHDDLLNSYRTQAWDKFLQMGLPSKNADTYFKKVQDYSANDFSLANTIPFTKDDVCSHLLPESKHSHIVFINGHFVLSLSDVSAYEDVELSSLNDAMETFGIYLQSRFIQNISREKDPFAVLNTAIYSKGAFFYLPTGQKTTTPLQILHFITEEDAYFSPRMQFCLMDQTNLTFTNSYVFYKKPSAFFYNYMMDISMGKQAQMHYCSYLNNDTNGMIFEGIRSELKAQAGFNMTALSKGKNLRQDYRVNLLEEESTARLSAVSFLKQQDFCQTNVVISHLAENCFSDQLFKSVLSDESRFYFSGKIYVEPVAQKTQAYQMNQNLVLSDKAILKSKPNLEILADDVKASHGMTATEIQKETLFYLTSRGLSEKEAKPLLVDGFCRSVLEKCPVASLTQKMMHGLC